MAIAGLHNVSVPDTSFLRGSQSQAARQQGNEGRSGTRSSSMLQMWREIEDEHVVSHGQERVGERIFQQRNYELSRTDMSDGGSSENSGIPEDVSVSENNYGQWSTGPVGHQNEQEDTSNFNRDHSSDLGLDERERVRQIFREWMNSGVREQRSNVSSVNHGSRAEWLGETEQERVRIIREWVQMNSRQRGARPDHRDEQVAEVGGQIERVLDGLAANLNEGRNEHIHRGIRRLCGRQALLDMLKKSERERQRELQGLLECRAVSQFAHRNRIQSLLRGRFLRNDRIIDSGRATTSVAASELGLLRQRQTVSDLRDGFLSRLDHSCDQAGGNLSDTSSNIDTYGNRNEQNSEISSLQLVHEIHGQFDSNNEEIESHGLSNGRTNMEGSILEERCSQEATDCLEEWSEQVSESDVRDMQQLASVSNLERGDVNGQEEERNWQEGPNSETSLESFRNEGDVHFEQPSEVVTYRSHRNREDYSGSILSDHSDSVESNTTEDLNQLESSTLVEQQHDQVLETVVGNLFGSNEMRGGIGDDVDRRQQETTNGLSQSFLGNEDLEHDRMQQASEVWRVDGEYQEAMQNWFDGPSDETVSVGRVDTFYLPDDGNVYSTEIRELLTRRSVSTLLRSGFRESLDRLIQSYVERQSQAPFEWEGTSTPAASAEQDLEQQTGDHNEGRGDAVGSPPTPPPLPPPHAPPVRQIWVDGPQDYRWSQHDMHHRLGIEWDIVNDLRFDMARLQQRMNNMQSMLEACMDMQLELQRSIRQEVSAALNRSSGSAGICENGLPEDGSKWDNVRKGICCICSNSNIDSLLYRCGHMGTCSKCANELVQCGGKCPMCRAPVVEVIRAYCIL
ncbi:Ring/U-Box superfamily protein putative isoform 1 [Tripterygium wilfordii]|uniref:Ring/U-Box superfamily protein putative isoform 1 n=1 Tax=Tripterygium wilfordii TaxID=458696 RepID=A0A7J7DEP0_TRIWF|nr:uncharacterized protein LOC120002672 [Tripterygium wilfordii]XP_038707362.1 uncharacterized protein LOC120002672 [Tripterygium wilfordii]XP_038707363.1 uncharacterized protein LOC120002672 [Tripterygium wilfordii]KAF5744792.1 Ring/U-Box superfamily protein putative isoform 1 [Tripterygium wilfordii]